jgi:hypothetical protein
MSAVLTLVDVLRDPRVWRGSADAVALATEPTGHALLDAALPGQGWPQHALSEILIPIDGIGELGLIVPTLARLTPSRKGCRIGSTALRGVSPRMGRARCGDASPAFH